VFIIAFFRFIASQEWRVKFPSIISIPQHYVCVWSQIYTIVAVVFFAIWQVRQDCEDLLWLYRLWDI